MSRKARRKTNKPRRFGAREGEPMAAVKHKALAKRKALNVPAHLLAHTTRGQADLDIMFALVNMLGSHERCLPRCRRYKRCASPTCACFDANIGIIRDFVRGLAGWQRLYGSRDTDDAARRARDLFD